MVNAGAVALRAVGLTKHYPIVVGSSPQHLADGATVASYRTLREAISDWAGKLANRRQARQVERHYALRDVTFEVALGTVLGVVGRNGAGKTTLLKVFSRITEPSDGWAEIHGRVGTLLEVGTGFHPELTGRENVYLAGAVLGMTRTELDNRFDQIVTFAEIERFLDVPLKRYSSGMYLRLAFAVAAHLETEIMLVDEVLAVGDLQFRQRCLGKIREVGRGGRTVMYVSHDMSSVRQLCDRVIWLDRGRIVADGPAAEVVARYEAEAYSGTATSGGVFVRRTEEAAGRAIWFSRVELLAEDGHPTTDYRWGDTMRLRMTLEGTAPADGYSIEWSILNERGERAAYGGANPQQEVYFDRADRVVECEIGPLPLTSGNYKISLAIWVWRQPRWDVWEEAATFRITIADPFGHGFDANSATYGVVVIPHRWIRLSRVGASE